MSKIADNYFKISRSEATEMRINIELKQNVNSIYELIKLND